MKVSQQISRASIYDAVKLSGGNGLASPTFEIPAEFFGIFSWQYVEEGTEALIVDGQIIHRADPVINLLSFLKRTYGRRVLLRPAPLIDLSASALTSDQMDVTLTVSINYTVRQAQQVAAMERPIETIRQLVVGIVAEHIRTDTLLNILGDNGQLRQELCDRLNCAPSIRELFNVVEVLKALPTGDERFIELGRKMREAELRQPLIDLEGRNRTASFVFDHEISAMRASLDEQLQTAAHQRAMQRRQAELDAQNFQSMAASIALAASTGADPARVAEVFLKMARQPPELNPPTKPAALSTPSDPASTEIPSTTTSLITDNPPTEANRNE